MKKGKTMPAIEARPKKLVPYMEGFDGAVIIDASVRLSSVRFEDRSLRARPGTFEWRYGRKSADSALYHAGIKFADMWERAGTSAAGSPDLGAAGGGEWKGVQDARLIAMDAIKALRESGYISKFGMARMVDYCVMGTSAADIASKWGEDARGLSHVLHEDLKSVARYMGYL